MHNDYYQFMVTAVVEPHGDRCQSYAYAVVLSYVTVSHRAETGAQLCNSGGRRAETAAALGSSYILTVENAMDVNTLKKPQNAKSYAYACRV